MKNTFAFCCIGLCLAVIGVVRAQFPQPASAPVVHNDDTSATVWIPSFPWAVQRFEVFQVVERVQVQVVDRVHQGSSTLNRLKSLASTTYIVYDTLRTLRPYLRRALQAVEIAQHIRAGTFHTYASHQMADYLTDQLIGHVWQLKAAVYVYPEFKTHLHDICFVAISKMHRIGLFSALSQALTRTMNRFRPPHTCSIEPPLSLFVVCSIDDS
jgi:hypothetical protein